MALSQIISDADIEAIIGKQKDTGRTRMRAIRTQVENAARRFVRHNITQPSSDYIEIHPIRRGTGHVAVTEYHDVVGDKVVSSVASNRRSKIRLRQKFARSITNVWEDLNAEFGNGSSDFSTSTLLTSGTDYGLQWDASEAGIAESSMLIRHNRWWPSKPGTVKVQYNAGLTAAELADEYLWVKQALIEEVAQRFYYHHSQAETTFGQTTGAPQKEQSIPGDFKETFDTTTTNLMLLNQLSPRTMRQLMPLKHNLVGV
jgi:hypothetical protein